VIRVLRDPANSNSASPRVRLSSAELRRELSGRNLLLAQGVPHESSSGAIPSVLYQELNGEHGNFLSASYRRICASPEWSRRLKKCYTASKNLARSADRTRRELDCANSSDALLMNVFCYPGICSRSMVCSILGIQGGTRPQFGVTPRIPTVNGRADRTEIDMSLGRLFVEAKLTEGGFQKGRPELVLQYQDFGDVFDVDDLPVSDGMFHSYQLIRGVLAAHWHQRSFLVLCDARRTDLREAWYRILRAVRSCELRSRLAILTWQELSGVLPRTLQKFLAEKYGIGLTV
jgi:restriction endonuclease-like protein